MTNTIGKKPINVVSGQFWNLRLEEMSNYSISVLKKYTWNQKHQEFPEVNSTSHIMTCTTEGHVPASPHQWPIQKPCQINHKLTDPSCGPKGQGGLSLVQNTCELQDLYMYSGCVYVKPLNKRKPDREACRTKSHLFPRMCNVQQMKNQKVSCM